MTLLLGLLGAPQAGEAETTPPPPDEEVRGGGGIGGTVIRKRRRSIIARTVEYRDAEEEMVILWL